MVQLAERTLLRADHGAHIESKAHDERESGRHVQLLSSSCRALPRSSRRSLALLQVYSGADQPGNAAPATGDTNAAMVILADGSLVGVWRGDRKQV